MCRSAGFCRGVTFEGADRRTSPALDKSARSGWLCATFPPSGLKACIATAPIPAARFARATSASRCGFRAGATASATMAACCSSTCATITASPKWSPIRTARPSRWPRRCARNGWCASTARCAGGPDGTENPELPTGAVEVYIREIEVLGAGRRTADAGVRRAGISRGNAAQIPLPRPAPRAAAPTTS